MREERRRTASSFEMWLRTGRAEWPLEYKFNGWHDPEDGRFTFVGAGRYFPPGSGVARQGRSRPRSDGSPNPDYSRHDPLHPRNYSVLRVARGDSLTRIARLRKGVTAEDLAWLNAIDVNAPLQIGQRIKLPHQSYLDEGRNARNRFLALAHYMDRHGGRLPPNPAHPPPLDVQLEQERTRIVANGYIFSRDSKKRTREASGDLRRNPDQGRSRSAQLNAGGSDRQPRDDGGHFIARQFDGPKEAFNHFAQDRTFNRSGYRRLENQLDRALVQGKKVSVHIEARYRDVSQRPFEIRFRYVIDGVDEQQVFSNEK